MFEALEAKFRDEAMRNLLLSTGDKTIVEDSPHDSYWGCGSDGKGQNMRCKCCKHELSKYGLCGCGSCSGDFCQV